MSRHVDEQTLAAFREGLLPARKAARITAHLATCQRCAEVDAQLAAVTTILARTPAPPMPASLAARLDAALAAEIARSAAASPSGAASAAGAPSRATAPAPGEHTERRGGTAAGRDRSDRQAGRGRAPWRLPLRLAAAAAAVVIVAGGGYTVAHILSAGHTGSSATSSGTLPSHNAISKPAASGLGPREAAPASVPPTVVASGTDYRPGHLPAQIGAVLGLSPAAPGSSPSRPKAAPSASAAAFPHLAECVAHLSRGVQPRLVDIARYGSQPAVVIVVPVPGAATLHVWVVGPGCHVITQASMPASG